MPKLKTNRSAAKRFSLTATGKVKHRKTNRSHILTKKAAKRKDQLRKTGYIASSDKKEVKKLLKNNKKKGQ